MAVLNSVSISANKYYNYNTQDIMHTLYDHNITEVCSIDKGGKVFITINEWMNRRGSVYHSITLYTIKGNKHIAKDSTQKLIKRGK